jgi:hypothetical protein
MFIFKALSPYPNCIYLSFGGGGLLLTRPTGGGENDETLISKCQFYYGWLAASQKSGSVPIEKSNFQYNSGGNHQLLQIEQEQTFYKSRDRVLRWMALGFIRSPYHVNPFSWYFTWWNMSVGISFSSVQELLDSLKDYRVSISLSGSYPVDFHTTLAHIHIFSGKLDILALWSPAHI